MLDQQLLFLPIIERWENGFIEHHPSWEGTRKGLECDYDVTLILSTTELDQYDLLVNAENDVLLAAVRSDEARKLAWDSRRELDSFPDGIPRLFYASGQYSYWWYPWWNAELTLSVCESLPTQYLNLTNSAGGLRYDLLKAKEK